MIVFSNTTLFIALASIKQLELPPRLFQQIHVVEEVVAECRTGGRIPVPDLTQLPWIQVVSVTPLIHSTLLLALDKGEKHTLDMAIQYHADWVIIDEKIGRNFAEYLGLKVVSSASCCWTKAGANRGASSSTSISTPSSGWRNN